MNLLIINPHLSTGGCPQYLYEFILNNKDKYEALKVVEFSNFSNEYVVQKNKIKNLIGEQNVISLGDFWEEDIIFQSKKYNLLNIIQQFNHYASTEWNFVCIYADSLGNLRSYQRRLLNSATCPGKIMEGTVAERSRRVH